MLTQRELRDQAVTVLQHYAEQNRHFTLEQLRETLGIEPRGKESMRLWNVWRQLQEAEVVEETTPARKRHQIYRVRNLTRLQAMQPVRVEKKRSRTEVHRLTALERRIDALERKLASLAD